MKKPSPKRTPPGKNGFVYKPRYGVIVLCADEAHHRRVYNALSRAGHKCRVVAV